MNLHLSRIIFVGFIAAFGVACHQTRARSDRMHSHQQQPDSPATQVDQKPPQQQTPDQGAQRGGVIDGNTGELVTTKNNPWFVGAAPARYCVEFGAETVAAANADVQKVINDQIDTAFAAWTDLIQVLKPQSPGAFNTPNGEYLAGDAVANLTRSFVRVDCEADPEVRVKVGTLGDEEAAFLKYTSRQTVAFALRTSYSEETGRSRGFLWLVADSGPHRYNGPAPEGAFWSQGNYVYNILLHELGHVIGVDHIEKSFMDASFPAAVLAGKLAAKWTTEDFKALAGFSKPQCGDLARPSDDPDAGVMKQLFGVEQTAIKRLCIRYAHDRRRPEDINTPMLLELKGDGDTLLAEQLMFVDGVYGRLKKVAGNYLRKTPKGDYRYSTVEHLTYLPFDMFRMHYTRDGRQHWVEAEVLSPGVFVLRFAFDGPWKAAAVFALPLARYSELMKALDAASFEEDEVIDD